MKIKEGYLLREITGTWIIVPVGQRAIEFNGLINLSESGALLWQTLLQDVDEKRLTETIMLEYDIDETTARADVNEYIMGYCWLLLLPFRYAGISLHHRIKKIFRR